MNKHETILVSIILLLFGLCLRVYDQIFLLKTKANLFYTFIQINSIPFTYFYLINFQNIVQQSSMDVFEAKIRGFHAKAVENIMTRTGVFNKHQCKQKFTKTKGDNITTYIRKFQVDRENLNLAKRILLCESEHDHKFYQRQWKKTENFLRVRSNFRRGLSNQEPRLFKFQPISGFGSCLLTLTVTRFQSSPIFFRPENVYCIKVLVRHNCVSPTNSTFALNQLGNLPMSFYVPRRLKKKKIVCKIEEMKQNEIYQKGRFVIDGSVEGQQELQVRNKQNKIVALIKGKIEKQSGRKVVEDRKQNEIGQEQYRQESLVDQNKAKFI